MTRHVSLLRVCAAIFLGLLYVPAGAGAEEGDAGQVVEGEVDALAEQAAVRAEVAVVCREKDGGVVQVDVDVASRQAHPAFTDAVAKVEAEAAMWLAKTGTKSVDYFHRELGKILMDKCGVERTAEGLTQAISEIQTLYKEFHADVRVPGSGDTINSSLEKAGRVNDFFELAELMCLDALAREESCGGHFRLEHQTEQGEARRDDENFTHVAAWEFNPDGESIRHAIDLDFEFVTPTQRSYK